jgi:Fur family ferric uptake transcriptional regulator
MSCLSILKEKGLRLTNPSRVILEYIHDRGGHLTAEEIISYVQSKYPKVNKSTISRTLEVLEKNQCVFKSESNDLNIYHHSEEGHHHHLTCSQCGKTVDCNEDLFAQVEQTLGEKYRFFVDFKHMVMKALCERCHNSPV